MAGGIPVFRLFAAVPAPDAARETAPVVIVGGGPVGLTLALDLGQRGHRVVLLNRLDFISAGSKAICFAKRALDIWDRLGVGEAMGADGVVWNTGKVFWRGDREPVYGFDMLPVKHQKNPAFINLPQYRAEEILVEAAAALPNVELRWGHEAVALDGTLLTVAAGEARYEIEAEWVIACDGARSPLRAMLGLGFEGRAFEDNFLIADIRLESGRPPERWFWFDPPFNPGQSALLHKQPDNVWRLDFQLGPDIDRAACVRPEAVAPLVRGMLGEEVAFEPVWYSVYNFQCRRMARFVHGRVVFAGDAAHLVSPFGARGCNGGIADAENLGWKLDLVLRGEAAATLIESYNDEMVPAADENIGHSTRSTDFISPKSPGARTLRDAVLALARTEPALRSFVNSGRLYTACACPDSPLITPDEEEWAGGVPPGAPALDAPLGKGWLSERLGGDFVLLGDAPGALAVEDALARERYDLAPGAAYLIRPDSYVAARWRACTPEKVAAAMRKATGR